MSSHNLPLKVQNIALCVLAAGLSSRFEEGHKLLANYNGKPLINYSAQLFSHHQLGARFVVINAEHDGIAAAFAASDVAPAWQIIPNIEAERGIGHSISLAALAAKKSEVEAILLTLADMPLINDYHLTELVMQARNHEAISHENNGIILPPILFRRDSFDALINLEGDKGAKQVFKSLDNTRTLLMDDAHAMDIDTRADLAKLWAIKKKTGADGRT